jgi:cell wall assembly regulator SMI1
MLKEPQPEDLRTLAGRAPTPPGYRLPSGASEQELRDFESRTGLEIPAQFRTWLAQVNGAMLGPGGLFGVRESSDPLSIERYVKIFPVWRELGWVPIASDGVGNYWVTAPGPDGSGGWVAFIDVHLDPGTIGNYAASTVFRFLSFLLNAELGEQGWPQNREYVLDRDPGLFDIPDSLAPWSTP